MWGWIVLGVVIGIVVGQDDVSGERKAYVGAGQGISRQDDIQSISTYGAKLTPEIAAKIAYLLNPPTSETKTVTFYKILI